jgi:glycosyltransferase involved in cell wall biosynthesis
MKIAILYPSLTIKGGAQNVVIWLAEGLSKRGHEVTIFTSKFKSQLWYKEERKTAFRIKELPLGDGYSGLFDWIRSGLILRKELSNYELVNPHSYPSYLWLYFAKRLGGRLPRIVWFCHEPTGLFYKARKAGYKSLWLEESKVSFLTLLRRKWKEEGFMVISKFLNVIKGQISNIVVKNIRKFFERRAVFSTERVLSNSHYTAKLVKEAYGIKALTCWPGVPVDEVILEKNFNDCNNKAILMVGTQSYKKNIESMLVAFDILLSNFGEKNIRLKIVGAETEYQRRLKALSDKLNIADHIDFVGLVSDQELKQLYQEAWVVVYPTLNEPFGLVPIEAMMYNTPIIGSNQGGVLETTIDGATSIQVNPLSPKEIADAVGTLLSNKDKVIQIGREGYKHAIKNFSLEAFINRFEWLAGIRS